MRRQPLIMMQQLESRRFLSAATFPAFITSPEIEANREALHDATQKLRTDARAGRSTIRGDQQAIRDELKGLAEDIGADAIKDALQPLKDELRADEKAKNKELRAALGELREAKRDARKLIAADLKAIRDAQGDDDAVEAAKKKLSDDKAQIQEDLKPIRDNIIAIKDKWRPIITADHQAIEDKLIDLDGDLKPLFAKLEDDAEALEAKLKADQQAVADAAEKLRQSIIDARNDLIGDTMA